MRKIELHESFSIVHSKLDSNPPMGRLLRKTYSEDYAPIHHLRAKLRYLRRIRGDVMHFFLLVDNPRYDIVGQGDFRHLESRTVNQLKWSLREEFNPKALDGSMSHNHIVHFSDNPNQALMMAKYLGARVGSDPANYFQESRLGSAWPTHLPHPVSVEYAEASVTDLRANIWVAGGLKLLRLEETPHWQSLVHMDPTIYENYLMPRLGTELRDGHSFSRLAHLLVLGKREGVDAFDPIIVKKLPTGLLQILDGVHRATVAQILKAERIFVATP